MAKHPLISVRFSSFKKLHKRLDIVFIGVNQCVIHTVVGECLVERGGLMLHKFLIRLIPRVCRCVNPEFFVSLVVAELHQSDFRDDELAFISDSQ